MSQEDQNAQASAALDAARAEGQKEGALAERARIQGILACDEAKNRREVAFHLSMNTELSVDAAKGILAAMPEVSEQAAAGTSGADFTAAMAKGNPELGGESAQVETADAGKQLIADYKAFVGGSK